MREILFRGKREDNGEWIEGYLVRRPSAIQVGEHCSPWAIDRPPNDPDDSGEVRFVDGNTVGQFTGLTDKNGRKIFEGDVVRYPWMALVKIQYNEKRACFFVEGQSWIGAVDGYSEKDSEVVGNVHDNPELLEVQ